MFGKNKPLYIIVHTPKCGGSSIENALNANLSSREFLSLNALYSFKPDGKPRTISDALEEISITKEKNIKSEIFSPQKTIQYLKKVDELISHISEYKKSNIKVVLGHLAYPGIERFFPNREIRYITFLRHPSNRIISHYNFLRTLIQLESQSNHAFASKYTTMKLFDINTWFLTNKEIANFMSKFLYNHYITSEKPEVLKNSPVINDQTFTEVKNFLSKFYFIGLTENSNDFEFLYKLVGCKQTKLPLQNSSTQYVTKTPELEKLIRTHSTYDLKLYKHAQKLNNDFKENNPTYNQVMARKRFWFF